MRRLVRCGSLLLLLLAFIVPTFAGDETKKKDAGDDKKSDTKKGDETEKKKKEKFVYSKKYVGKITQLDANSATKDFTLHLTGKVTEIDQGVQNQLMQQQQQLVNHQREYANARTFQGKQQAMQRIQQSVTQINQTDDKTLQGQRTSPRTSSSASRRIVFSAPSTPEPEYDDKGNPVELTKADKERLKGKLKDYVPGYQAEADALKNNVMVAVYTPKIDPAAKKVEKKKTDDDDAPPVASDRAGSYSDYR